MKHRTDTVAHAHSFALMPEPILAGIHKISVAAPDLSKLEEVYLLDAYRSTWVSSAGPYISRFEKAFAKLVSKTRYAVAVNSGTSALHLALLSCDIGEGDEVIVPTFTMIATANAVTYCGAKPIFIDADPFTWNMDVTKIESKITKKTKAIMVVHVYGLPVDMDPVLLLAKKHGLRVIEDAAEAHGALYKGKRVGSIGDIAGFSLYANKIITTGEGGMVTTNDRALAEKVAYLRDHAFSKRTHFWHNDVGFSYNMTNLQAAVGLGQTERFRELFMKRKKLAAMYKTYLKEVRGFIFSITPPESMHAHWVFGFRVDASTYGMTRDQVRLRLAKHGIETRGFFIPIHLQPAYAMYTTNESYPVSDMLMREGLYLPSSGILTHGEIMKIVRILSKRD